MGWALRVLGLAPNVHGPALRIGSDLVWCAWAYARCERAAKWSMFGPAPHAGFGPVQASSLHQHVSSPPRQMRHVQLGFCFLSFPVRGFQMLWIILRYLISQKLVYPKVLSSLNLYHDYNKKRNGFKNIRTPIIFIKFW